MTEWRFVVSEYTDQEIEMLVGFMHEYQYPGASKDDMKIWQACMWCRDVQKALVPTQDEGDSAPAIRAAARLMREAREQGAASTAIDRDRLAWLEKWYPGQEEQNRHLHQSIAKQKAKHATTLIQAREQGAAEMRERAALVAMQPDICPVDGPVAAERIRSLPLSVPK